MRNRFSKLLTEAAIGDDRILLLTGDHGYALFDEFRKACPDRFINCGIAEQNMVGVAAGLAKAGFRPIVYGLAAFVPMRVLEQIKMDICYENLAVILIGDGAGVVYGQLGSSHQCTEDVAALRAIPNIDICSPCDVFELDYCFQAMLNNKGASYLRFGKADLGSVHHKSLDCCYGDIAPVLNIIADSTIVATGSMTSVALAVANELGNCSVWSAPVIAPVNQSQIIELARKNKYIFVLEEHSVSGGLGSAIAEITAELSGDRASIIRVGIQNKFSELCGDYNYLMHVHGLDKGHIKELIVKCQKSLL